MENEPNVRITENENVLIGNIKKLAETESIITWKCVCPIGMENDANCLCIKKKS